MSRSLLAATPFAGHVRPMLGLARALLGRGHEVVVHTGARYAEAVREAGAEHLPYRAATDFDDTAPEETFPAMARARGPRALLVDFRELFFGIAPGQAQDMLAAHEQDPLDAVIAEGTCFGAELFHELSGVPYATASLSPLALPSRYLPPPGAPFAPGRTVLGRGRDAALRLLLDRTVDAAFRRLHDEARSAVGIARTDRGGLHGAWSRDLILAQGTAEVEPFRPDLPPAVHFVGDLAAGSRGAAVAPDWFAALDPCLPLVHVSEGTLGRDGSSLVARTVQALRDRPVQLVIGGRHRAGRLPADVIDAGWVPQDLLLPRTDLFVTNGGYGGMMAALSHGVPVLAVPSSVEKWVGAGNVASSGAGRRLRPGRASPAALDRAVGEMLRDGDLRQAAQRVAGSMAAAGGPGRAAELCEELLEERGPRRIRA
ncbi:glycosyltransferase [Brachybacterium hainanense]|uniref:Glycosyltransferase n=1 Tax=Brachybacterium hainanense TaxID=1541174 RepID=A0ABV6R8N1_9MICO